jgi:FMN phosphatase YigB (HAD superfamily)/uridine kinase
MTSASPDQREGAIRSERGFDVVSYPILDPQLAIIDFDGTLHTDAAYLAHTKLADLDFIADRFGLQSVDEADVFLASQRARVGAELGLDTQARVGQTMFHLGVTPEEWDVERCARYQPEAYLQPDSALVNTLAHLNGEDGRPRAVIGTNSPAEVVGRALSAMGVNRSRLSNLSIYSPTLLGTSKPDPEFFASIARAEGVEPESCVSIGDDHGNDAAPALQLGMGSILVRDGSRSVAHSTRTLAHGPMQVTSIDRVIADVMAPLEPDESKVIGFTGRAGAGKTSTSRAFSERCADLGIPVQTVSLDWFFRLSSRDRSAWLSEPGMDVEERLRREDQSEWWDFQRAAEVLEALKKGQLVRLRGVYNQEDGGNLSHDVDLQAPRGTRIIIEGVGVPLLPNIDGIVFVNAHERVRQRRVMERDIAKRGPEAAAARWQLTQRSEDEIFRTFKPNGGPLSVIDNSLPRNGTQNLRLIQTGIVPLK